MSLPNMYVELDTPSNKLKRFFKQVYKILKIVLFITMIILTFKVSERSSDYILDMSYENLSRVINVILVLIIVLICKRK